MIRFLLCMPFLLLFGGGVALAQPTHRAAPPMQQAFTAPAPADAAPAPMAAGRTGVQAHDQQRMVYALLRMIDGQHGPQAVLPPPTSAYVQPPADDGGDDFFIPELEIVYEAREAVKDATTVEGPHYMFRVDPLNRRCTLKINLSRLGDVLRR